MKIHASICCVLFVGVLLATLVQTLFHALPEPALDGESIEVRITRPSPASWLSGRFQDEVEDWLPRHVGFRAVWVRTDNQIEFSLFREIRGVNVVLGKDNWLYSGDHESLYQGWKSLSDEELAGKARDLKDLQDGLQRRGITFLFVLSPTKAAHYPEQLPDWVVRECHPEEFSNHRSLVPLLDRYGVHYVDAVQRFHDEKSRRPYLLFPRGGMHWSHFGASLVLEEMLERLEQLTGKDLVNLKCLSVLVDDEPQGADNDLSKLLNTWTPRATVGPTPHPQLARFADGNEHHPRILWIGSSFSLTLLKLMEFQDVYEDCKFLAYYRRGFRNPGEPGPAIDDKHFSLQSELLSRDIVILEANENEVDRPDYPDYGFLEEALEILQEGRPGG
jgi:hypothetical protein